MWDGYEVEKLALPKPLAIIPVLCPDKGTVYILVLTIALKLRMGLRKKMNKVE